MVNSGKLNKSPARGFTLMEVLLVMVIAASAALAVTFFLPEKASQRVFGQQFQALLEYAADKAVSEQQITGVALRAGEYQLMVLKPANTASNAPVWRRLETGRYAATGQIPDALLVSQGSALLSRDWPDKPQLIFLPDGESTPFRLTFEDQESGETFTLAGAGFLPFSLTSGKGE